MKNYIVFDLEWNQSPSGKDGSVEKMPFEIIEIGAVKLDENFKRISEFHKLIRPMVYQEMHYKISEVTHMKIEELENLGELFIDAAESFLEWSGKDGIYCTWGSMDLTELQRNMEYYGMEEMMSHPLFYYDVQKLYSINYDDGKSRHSLDLAVEALGIDEDRPFHRALEDAYYTGKVLKALDFNQIKEFISIDYYKIPQNKEEEIYLEFPGYSKYVSRAFETKEEAIDDKTVTDVVCYRCKRMLRKKVRWFSYNQKVYFCLAICPEHGFVKGKIRMKKTEEGKIFVVKTTKLVGEEGADQIYLRKEDMKKRRSEKSIIKKACKKMSE